MLELGQLPVTQTTDHLQSVRLKKGPLRRAATQHLDRFREVSYGPKVNTFQWESGASRGTRTPDLVLTKDLLYQLSY